MRISAVIFLILFSTTLCAQEEVTVTEVMVWVKAIDRSGKSVTGLTQADFEIFEDGKKVTPTCFEETRYSSFDSSPVQEPEQQATAEPAAVPIKRVAIILDAYNTQQTEYLYIRPKITEFLTQVPASWEIMLATVIPGAIEINVPFTNDRKEMQSKLDQITANAQRDIEVMNRRRVISNILRGPAKPQTYEAAYRHAQEYSLEERQMSRETIKALERFEKDLVRLKNDSHMVVLFISGGINSEPGKHYFDMIDRKAGSEFSQSSILAQREQGTDLWSMLRRIVGQFNRHNITFYTVNTRGLEGPVPDSMDQRRVSNLELDSEYMDHAQEMMAEIADETGGIAFDNSSDFRRGFDLILADLSQQYLICYKAPPHKNENERHKIKVETKKSGVKLRHRKAYLD
jgi:VWFA-related protein